ncbi:AMP-dependent synthetase [Labrys miyagiensis]|uniref:AMP-dependent synthetase n=1 Tax=Labrys miyagiensis TaxID=346912 RepID=A0ABQ6CC17_9HYPH|nr:AMP-binding protein [Labrys miyagiensis]GLS17690.1 AMP-dependent synthetase [Labrys miyagiensis]
MAAPLFKDYATLRREFHWDLPARYNIGADVCDVWAKREPDRTAILRRLPGGGSERISYGTLREASDRFALALKSLGVGKGDRVAILLPQSPAVVIAHLATAKLGAISLPLAVLFGPDALAYRLRDSGAKVVLLDEGGLAKLGQIETDLPDLETLISVDGAGGGALDFESLVAGAQGELTPVASTPGDPAMMIYTSGTTGQPKGAVHGHRVVPGHIPGLRFAHPGLGQADDVMWTPADWAWAGGLLNVLLPSLALGVPVVAGLHAKFSVDEVLALLRDLKVRNAFLPPTALRMLQAAHRPGEAYRTHLRSIMSAGETLGPGTYEWAREAFGFPVNELYGQTECNLVLGSSFQAGISRPGAIGKSVPGHEVEVQDEEGLTCAPGEIGEIVVKAPDPVMFLHYWRNEKATAAKFRKGWLLTGDKARRDEDGYLDFIGRSDDIITSAGYRIGPGEIEDCLMRHPAVAMAAVIGAADTLRTEIVKAFLVLKPGFSPSAELTRDVQLFVRERLSAHEYPRVIAYAEALPMTSSGKIIRRALREGD